MSNPLSSGHTLPHVQTVNWQLSIGGQIEGRERVFRWDDIQRYPLTELPYTLECIGNPVGGSLIRTAQFQGVRLWDLLAGITLKSGMTHARFLAADGYRTYVPLEVLQHPDTLLAVAMDEQPLTPEQGFPARLLIPGVYGYKSPKWILRMELTDQPGRGDWESRGWSEDGLIQTHAILNPNQPPINVDQPINLSGIAMAGTRGIASVEVRIDGGAWLPAQVIPGAKPYLAAAWSLQWTPAAPGDVLVEVRATDGEGHTQSETASTSPKPNGCAAIQRRIITVEP